MLMDSVEKIKTDNQTKKHQRPILDLDHVTNDKVHDFEEMCMMKFSYK
jgi:hypothetical protein